MEIRVCITIMKKLNKIKKNDSQIICVYQNTCNIKKISIIN